MQQSDGFPAVAGTDARILILGSLPGQRSIAKQQYYAHPQNAFWRIMRELLDIEGNYAHRCKRLVQNQIALWDVLASSVRPGSMDAHIHLDTAKANDFASFLECHTQVRHIAFNGKKAEQLFYRFVDTDVFAGSIQLVGLPSTSPAYAAMSFSGKLAAWREVIRPCDTNQTKRRGR